LAKRVCRSRKPNGLLWTAARGTISSLAFPATLWRRRDRPSATARTISFLAPFSPRYRRRLSARRRALSVSLRSAAAFRSQCWPLAELRWRTRLPVSLLALRGSRPFGSFRIVRMFPRLSSHCENWRGYSPLHQPAEQADLAGMVDVVKRDAVKLFQKFRSTRRAQYLRHGLT
jgi:hypothetical protein